MTQDRRIRPKTRRLSRLQPRRSSSPRTTASTRTTSRHTCQGDRDGRSIRLPVAIPAVPEAVRSCVIRAPALLEPGCCGSETAFKVRRRSRWRAAPPHAVRARPRRSASDGERHRRRGPCRPRSTVRSYRDLVGLPLLVSFDADDGPDTFAGAVFGMPGTAVTFELVESATPVPVDDHERIVLYLAEPTQRDELADRLKGAGLMPCKQDRYWDDNDAVTFQDPDGWEIVFARLRFRVRPVASDGGWPSCHQGVPLPMIAGRLIRPRKRGAQVGADASTSNDLL